MNALSGMSKLRLGVLASGRGSNLQAIIDAIEDSRLQAVVAVVISNKSEAPALEIARRHGCSFFDIAGCAQVDENEGIHLTRQSHAALAA